MPTVNNNINNNVGNTQGGATTNNDNASGESVGTAKDNISKIKAKMAEHREKMKDKKEDFLSGLAGFFAGQADKVNDIFIKVVGKRIERLEKHNEDGSNTEKITKEKEKLTKLQGAGQFWKSEKTFWDAEKKLNYPAESHEKVADYYHQIGHLERKFANIALGLSHDDPAAVTNEIAELRSKISQLGGVAES